MQRCSSFEYSLLMWCMLTSMCRLEEIRIDISALYRKTSEHFVGLAIDTDTLKRHYDKFSIAAQTVKLHTLASALAPSYVRVGGTSSDFLIFDDNSSADKQQHNTSRNRHLDLNQFSYSHGSQMKGNTVKSEPANFDCYLYGYDVDKDLNNFTVTGQMLDTVYQFVSKAGWNMTFDLNVFMRNQSEWDPTNAEKLIDYTVKHGYQLAGWELGNEPNAFYHLIKWRLEPEQLAQDYRRLREILRGYKQFDNAIILGPSVTQLNKKHTIDYFQRFMTSGGANIVTAATFHQYYLAGKTCVPKENFTDPNILNHLVGEVVTGLNITRSSGSRAKLWIGETSSAIGKLQEKPALTYRAGFMWLDKLGVSASGGVDVVIRQSFYGGINSLIDRQTLDPRPDYWLTLLYKQLVGSKVLRVTSPSSLGKLRAYAHCTAPRRSGYSVGSIVVYVMNLYDDDRNLTFPDYPDQEPLHVYTMTPKHGRLDSRTVLLNDRPLKMVDDDTLPDLRQPYRTQAPVTLKSFTYTFIVFPQAQLSICTE